MQTSSDYGQYLANEASPLFTTTIVERCTQKLVNDWNYMRTQVCILGTPATANAAPSFGMSAPFVVVYVLLPSCTCQS